MQDLLVLGIVPGTSFVIPLYFWVVFGLAWIILFWNIDKIHLHRKLHIADPLHAASASLATTSTSAVSRTISTLAHMGTIAVTKLVLGLTIAVHLTYKVTKQFVIWADKKANSVHASDLKKIMPSNE